MSFKWPRFLDLAEHLINSHAVLDDAADHVPNEANVGDQRRLVTQASQEAAFRTSISRSYYAAYHVVREYVELVGRGVPPKADSHTWVWNQLHQTNRRQERQIRESGIRMNKARRVADYDIEAPANGRNWGELAKQSVLAARQIHRLIMDIQPKQ